MSNADFQKRLQRIGAGTSQHQAVATPISTGPQKMRHGLVFVGALLLAVGIQALKYANQNYEVIRDSDTPGVLIGLVVGGLVALLLGIVTMLRGLPNKHAARTAEGTVRQPSARARICCSLLGFAFGAIAMLYMFMAAAARFIETEKAQDFASGGVVIALGLALVSLVFGFTGLFLRSRALGRVPVYFLFGAALIFAAVRLSGLNMLEWQQFADALR